MKRFWRQAIVVLALAGLGSIAAAVIPPAHDAKAAGCTSPSIVFGRWRWCGYFYNKFEDTGLNVRDAGVPSSVNTAQEFINLVEGDYSSGDTHKITEAVFVVRTMIGDPLPSPPCALGTCKSLSGAQITEFEKRVKAYGNISENGTTSTGSNGSISWWHMDYMHCNTDNTYYQDGYHDIAPYIISKTNTPECDNSGVQFDHIIFYDKSGNVLWKIRRLCMNPLGTIKPLAAAPSYNLTGASSVSDTTVIPGQTITFTHKVTNSGPDTAPGVRYTVYHNGAVKATGGPFNLGVTTNTVNTNSFKIPAGSLPGTKFCQYVHFTPKNEDGGSGDSAQACATVIADFNLIPTVLPSTGSAQQNDTISFTYSVHNDGPTPSTTTTCKVVGNAHAPGYTPLPQQDVDRTSDAGYSAPATNCPRNFLEGSDTQVATETVSVGNAAPGSRICRSLVVNPKDETGGFRASAEGCVVVAKTPYVHFQGNDVWAGGGFSAVNPACNTASKITTAAHALQDGTVAGGGVEYAAFALGKITNFGSAGHAIINPAAPLGKMLTFSNTNSSNLGFYGAPQHCINDYITTYSGTPITTKPATIDVNQASGTYQINGAHTFHGNVPNGSSQIWLVNGDVTIDGDIKYSDSYSGVADIPSLVIITTGKILVQDNVKQMDGLFVSRGTFNSCSNAPATLSVSTCNNQLVVNGSVITGALVLQRTFGADGSDDGSRKVPAEVFNFSPEMYLKSALNGDNASTLKTVDTKDLPPRY